MSERISSKNNWISLSKASASPDPLAGQPPTTPKETHVRCPYNHLPTPTRFQRELTLCLAIYIYIIYLHSRPLKSLRAPAAGQGCVHKAKCKCMNALKTESGHKLHITGPTQGHWPAPGTGTPRHTHLPLYSPGLPLHIHTPRWAGHLEAGGRERNREEPSGVPGWVGEGQHVRGRCVPTPGVRDVSSLQVHSMRCVLWGRVLHDLGEGCV